MPLRILVERDSTVFKLAAAIKAETRSCYRHQRFPLSEVLRHCRSLDGFCHGVFDVTVVYRKLDYGLTFGGAPMRVTTLDTGVRSETLSLEIDDYGAREDVNLFFNANPRLISRPELEQMAGSFELLLLDLAMDGDLPVRELRLASGRPTRKAAERTSLPAHSIVDMVERKAIEAPESVAITCGGRGVTRGELSQWSNCVRRLPGVPRMRTGGTGGRHRQPNLRLDRRDHRHHEGGLRVPAAGSGHAACQNRPGPGGQRLPGTTPRARPCRGLRASVHRCDLRNRTPLPAGCSTAPAHFAVARLHPVHLRNDRRAQGRAHRARSYCQHHQ